MRPYNGNLCNLLPAMRDCASVPAPRYHVKSVRHTGNEGVCQRKLRDKRTFGAGGRGRRKVLRDLRQKAARLV